MNGLYHKMTIEAQSYQKFKSMNGRDILDFPLHIPMGVDILIFLEDTFNKYSLLLEHMQKIRDVHHIDINIDSIKKFGNTIIDVMRQFRNGKIVDAYYSFEQQIDEIYESLPIWKMNDGEYYRMRKDINLNRVCQMYPLPPELRYLSGGMRFSIPGYSCLYLGHSESVCKLEISNSGSMIKIKPKGNVEFSLIDLTFSDDMMNGGAEEIKFIHAWPLIASCYIDNFYCLRGERTCPPEAIKFNEKYVIPQFLTAYIRRKHEEIDGIRYYTVKDKDLDPLGRGKKDMRNVVVYVDSSSDLAYDSLIDKFEWGKPYNV